MVQATPRHIVAVSAFITNEAGEVLLVKTQWRSDTWECPGGQVEEGEALDLAVYREVLEETGIEILVQGVTGVYYNATRGILSVVFKALAETDKIRIQPSEIQEAQFVELTKETIGEYITRPHMHSRTLDAMKAESYVPYETWKVSPNLLLGRLDNRETAVGN